jgi:hypothetical protein
MIESKHSIGDITTTVVAERRHIARIDRSELKRIIIDAVLTQIGRAYDPKSMKVKVTFEDDPDIPATCRAETRCVVEIVEDMRPQDAGA